MAKEGSKRNLQWNSGHLGIGNSLYSTDTVVIKMELINLKDFEALYNYPQPPFVSKIKTLTKNRS